MKTQVIGKGMGVKKVIIYLFFILFTSVSFAVSVSDMKKSAEQGNSENQANLGVMYEKGHGVERDYDKALFWYKKSADQGNVDAFVFIGNMYEKGIGVKRNYREAISWYEKAANKNNAYAYNALAFIYEDGLEVRQDLFKAKEYFGKACDLGDKFGCEQYRRLNQLQ